MRSKIDALWIFGVLVLVAVVIVALTRQRPQAQAPTADGGAPLAGQGPRRPPPRPAPTPLPINQDPLRRRVLGVLEGSGGPDERSRAAAAALAATLERGPRLAGVRFSEPRAYFAGAYADVTYASPELFFPFDENRLMDPSSPFEQWKGPNGRTGLLRRGEELLATWYFFVDGRGARTPAGSSGQ